MENNKVTKISFYFKGIKKRCRSVDHHIEKIVDLVSSEHKFITPEEFLEYERKAFELVDSLGYKNVQVGQIHVNHGVQDEMFLSMNLMPKQKHLVMR